jgi:DNA-binding Xre family transcriptional regulator
MRNHRRFEAMMKAIDVNGADVARGADLSRQYVSLLRQGIATTIAIERAEAIERFLGCRRGMLFDYGDDPEPTNGDTHARVA